MNDQQNLLYEFSTSMLKKFDVITEDMIEDTVKELVGMPMFNGLSTNEIQEVIIKLKANHSIQLDIGSCIEENKSHEKWFVKRKQDLEMQYWSRYKEYLLRDKKFSTKVVNTMDDILDTLTDLLGDPTEGYFPRKGLVIGDVQSGKTANYIGLMCKAADAGFKVIVLLTGTIEKLRQQTQQRVDEGFVGFDSDAMIKQQNVGPIGVGRYNSSFRPFLLTSTSSDFKTQTATNLNFDLNNINGTVVFVVKKNSTVLKRLSKWLDNSKKNNTKINESLLVIDDEADNASINTKNGENPTTINNLIREILESFTKSSYVGFTATPFANIFIDPESNDAMGKEDLFPKDYIYSLNAPSNYIGARDMFSEEGKYRYMLEPIYVDDYDEESIEYQLPLKHKSTCLLNDLPKDLKEAICTFILANTIEDIRGMKNNHRSMLVNVSRFTRVQESVWTEINSYVKNIQNACKLYCMRGEEDALRDPCILDLYETYENIYKNTVGYSWNQVQNHLYESCKSIVVQTINQRSTTKLDYDNYENGLRLIAIGGMSLSRGLTLEGLIVSYFYRNSRMYDTLMQMGRWFGYRSDYGDLCRIWMSSDSIEWYSYISEATDDLRDLVKRYEDTGLTPLDFGLRVRSDITSLIVTAYNKMRSAERRECMISLSGEYIETPEIYTDLNKNRLNLNAVKEFVSATYDKNKMLSNEWRNKISYGIRGVSVENVLKLLEHIDVSPKNEQFDINTITSFIREYKGTELDKWDVHFVSGEAIEFADLGHGIKYHYNIRNYTLENDGKIAKMSGSKRKLAPGQEGRYGLTESQLQEIVKNNGRTPSTKAYFRGVNRNPLLSIFLVKPQARTEVMSDERYIEFEQQYDNDVLVGFGIGIPELSDVETKYAKYVLNKIAIQQMFDDEWDDYNPEED